MGDLVEGEKLLEHWAIGGVPNQHHFYDTLVKPKLDSARNKRLVVIIRCDGYRKDAGKLASRVFGALGFAGGHREKARAEVPMENLSVGSHGFTTRTLLRLLERHFRK
jgi:hypothetical protein